MTDTPMPLWQRILLTLVAVVLVGFLAGLLWMAVFNREMPAYLSGLLGGLAAMPVWELLKRVSFQSRPKQGA
jgi:glucose-6-phosphate-specific signal transduction histidine kinase